MSDFGANDTKRTEAGRAYSRVIDRLNGLRSYHRGIDVLFGLLVTVSVGVGWLLLTMALESIFRLSGPGRLILLAAGLFCMAAVCFRSVLRPLFASPSLQQLALRLEERFPHYQERLIGTLQLWEKHTSNPEGYSIEMIDAAAAETMDLSGNDDFRSIINIRKCWKSGQVLIALAVIAVLLLSIFPTTFYGSLVRAGHPFTDYPKPRKTFIVVSPGDTETVSGEDVAVNVRVTGEIPADILLYVVEKDQENGKTYSFIPASDRLFEYTIPKVKRSLQYRVEAGDAASPLHTVSVVERPMVRRLKLRYTYPPHTRLGARDEEDNVGDIRAIVGTTIQVELVANKMLDSAVVVMNDGETIMARTSGREARGSFVVRRDGSYHIELKDKAGLENTEPIEYRITATSDEYPVVRILKPGQDTELTEEMSLPLVIDGTDDYGFSRLLLSYRLGEEGTLQTESVPLPRGAGAEISVDYLWDLTGLDLVPEDVVFYYAELYDNDRVTGPKGTKSRTYMVRFPSIYEIYAEVEKDQEEQLVDLEEMMRESRDLKERLDQVVREMQRETDMDWEKQKETEGALKRQKEMAEDLKQLSEEMNKTIEKLEENNLVSPETLEKMDEIQKLMEEIATPDLMEALEKLQQAMQQLDRRQLQEAMKDFSFNQEDFQKRLERTIEMLKRIQMEQKMDAMVKKMDELIERQEDINQSTDQAEDGEEMNDLAEQQENMKRDLDRLKEELEELSEMLEEMPLMPQETLDSLAQAMEEQQLSEMMSQAEQMMTEGQKMQAQKKQQQISQGLQQMSQGMKMAQSQMMQNMFQEVLEAMQKATHQLLDLSHQQESLSFKTEEMRSNSQQCNGMAEKQMDTFNNAAKVANSLFEASKKNFMMPPDISRNMGRAMSNMEGAINHLEQRNPRTATKSQREAMADLNETVMKMRQSMQSMCSAGQCSGSMQQMLQQLDRMAQQQMGLNQQTMQMQQSGELSMEQRASLGRLAAEQEMIRKELEDLRREMGTRPEILGRFDGALEDMKKVSEDLRGRQLNPETINRQNRILSRLLDYQMSLRQRDYTRRRRAKTGTDFNRTGPGELPLDLGERQDQLRQDLLNALKEDYPKEYKDLIRAYFEALSREQQDAASDM